MVNIRDWANNRGFKPNQVKYDKKTKRVSVDGVDYGKGTPTYRTQMNEIRPSDTTTYYQPQKIQTGAKFSEAVLDDTLLKSRSARADNALNQSKESLINFLNKGQGEFKYDPNTDLAYKAQVEQGQRNIADAIRKTEEDMAARGIFGSSSMTERIARIKADEQNRLATQIAPVLEQQARDRFDKNYQNKIQALQTVYGINKDDATVLAQRIEKAQADRNQRAQYLTELYNKVVNPTIDPADMDKQVAGMKTWKTVEANRTQGNIDKEYNFKSTEATRQQKNFNNELQLRKDEAKQRQENFEAELKAKKEADEAQRKHELKMLTIKNANTGGSGGSGGSGGGGGGGSVKYDKAKTVTIKDATGIINNALKQASGNQTIKTGKLTNEQKNAIRLTINSLTMSAADRASLFRQYGLMNDAIEITKDPTRVIAKNNPDRLIKVIEAQRLDNDEMIRKLVYYNLYDYYMTRYGR